MGLVRDNWVIATFLILFGTHIDVLFITRVKIFIFSNKWFGPWGTSDMHSMFGPKWAG